METRGRKSEAEREVSNLIAPVRLERPEPPDYLSAAEAVEWRVIVARMPADWFKAEHLSLLAAHCGHVWRGRELAADLRAQARETDDELKRYERLQRMVDIENRAALTHATKLRLTHQSRYDEKKAFTATRDLAGARPWEVR